MALTDREKLVITRFVDGYNEAMDSHFAVSMWPDGANRSSPAIDAIALDADGKVLAIEHTLLQPFDGERYDTSVFLQTIATLDRKPTLVLDGFDVTLSVWMINTVALDDEDYSPSYLIWPLQAAYEFDLARNGLG